ncbi:NAD(P)-dependent oxidoreductase [Pseudaminobacter sp. 19-2017]|uniref:NAD(P)-dependent oxidoreductase n=1 Tax=Pseudaminobacter soli (ex Zhang et al. 2022) TaxID=2831468 RepID=A0A942E0D1_9HYPH|nr:NAD(P)-dependent oxidoreductase [Pseudaminobacter soli]MBS3651031.1 NAD(P)-dependent oxidoreductase [Pseudaminobacter soli]
MQKGGQGSFVLVSGASGFIGAAVTRALRSAGRGVLAIDIRGDEAEEVIHCDLLEAHRLHELARECDIEAILHCGGVSGPMLYADRPGIVARTNVEGTLNLLELARIHRISRFVFCSSASVYGPRAADDLVCVESALHPRSAYAASKIAGEALVEAYSNCHGLDGISLRIAAVYGPGRRTDCFIREMILAGLNNRPLSIGAGGSQRYHFVHIDDVVSALTAALWAVSARRTHTIAGGPGLTLRELADVVRAIVPGPDIIVGSALDGLSDPQGIYDLSSSRADFGWTPSVPLEDGIASYVEWLSRDSDQVSEPAADPASTGEAPAETGSPPTSRFSTGDA